MNRKLYACTRPMDGDKFYNEGDPREALPTDVAHLVTSGALREPTDADLKRWGEAGKKPAKKTKVKKPAQTKVEEPVAIKVEGEPVVNGPIEPVTQAE